jgi:hypothetical protein
MTSIIVWILFKFNEKNLFLHFVGAVRFFPSVLSLDVGVCCFDISFSSCVHFLLGFGDLFFRAE